MRRDTFNLENIVDEITILKEMLEGKDIEDHLSDEILKRVISKTLENAGGSVKGLSDDLKVEYDTIEWKDIAGLRDMITHRYHGIDHYMIWNVCQNKIDELYGSVKRIPGCTRNTV